MSAASDALKAAGRVTSALFLPQYSIDPTSGEMVGHGTGYVGIAITQAIAEQLAIKAEVKGLPSPPKAMEALLAGDVDIVFFGIEPGRQAKVDFTPPLFEFDYTYMVPAQSPCFHIADADQAGTRIVIMDSHASALALIPQIHHATILKTELPEEAFETLRRGDADVFASPRDVLLGFAEKWPGARVLDDAFGVNRVGMAVRKQQPELLAFLSEVVERAKADGTVARLIADGDLRGFRVAT